MKLIRNAWIKRQSDLFKCMCVLIYVCAMSWVTAVHTMLSSTSWNDAKLPLFFHALIFSPHWAENWYKINNESNGCNRYKINNESNGCNSYWNSAHSPPIGCISDLFILADEEEYCKTLLPLPPSNQYRSPPVFNFLTYSSSNPLIFFSHHSLSGITNCQTVALSVSCIPLITQLKKITQKIQAATDKDVKNGSWSWEWG